MPRSIISRTLASRLRPLTIPLETNHVGGVIFNKQTVIRIEKFQKIDLILHNVLQLASSDSGLQGDNDEVFAWKGVAIRSDKLVNNEANQVVPLTENITVPAIENIDLTSPYDPSTAPPYPVLIHSFDLQDQLKTDTIFSVTLFVVEGDNGNLGDSLKEYSALGIKAIKDKSAEIAGELAGDLGGAIGGAVGGPIGAFIGKVIIGKLIALGIDEVVDLIVSGLNDDKMNPFVFNSIIDKQNFIDLYGTAPVISSGIKNLDYQDGDAHYVVCSEWKLYRDVKNYSFSIKADYKSSNEQKANEKEIVVPAGTNGRCSGNGFTSLTWSINRDFEYNISILCSDIISDYAMYIDGQKLTCDGNIRAISLFKEVEINEQFNYTQKNILIEYKSTGLTGLLINTKGVDGNYDLKIKIVCFGKEILNEIIEIKGQEFTGDEKYKDYMQCIFQQLQFKASLTPLPVKVSDFIHKNGPIPMESFGIDKRIKNIGRLDDFDTQINSFQF